MSSPARQQEISVQHAPVLLCELEPWWRVFRRNLGDVLLRREPPPIAITARPVPVPCERFIETGVHPEPVLESYAGHVVFVILVYLICSLPPFHRAPQLHSPFENAKVEYYPVSEYLPPLNTGNRAAIKPRHGAPKLAKQEILSLPPDADNSRQTIVTPPKVKLKEQVPLPNIVAWTPVPAAQPIAASARSVSQLKVAQLEPAVAAPTADLSQLKAKLLVPPELRPTVVGPTADVSQLRPKLQNFPEMQPSVVEPALSPDQLKLKAGQLNIAQLEPQVAAPMLPIPPQHAAAGSGDSTAKSAAPTAATARPVPLSSLQSLGNSQGQGQLIALGLDPAGARGPIVAPGGNRSGEFHASPGGKPDAPGTPNVSGSGNGAASGAGVDNGLPPGIKVGAPPPGAATAAIAGAPSKVAGTAVDNRKQTMAALLAPSLPNVRERRPPPPTLPEQPDPSIEHRVFGGKRYYKLVMNMPNLTSATGSWIIHFAELGQSSDKSSLEAPVATVKVDPAYPPEVLRDKVEGTVTLYAIIRADGSVAGIRVLDSLDSRLDENAARALSGWHFLPGTKNGAPVALEAVVEVPFRLRHSP